MACSAFGRCVVPKQIGLVLLAAFLEFYEGAFPKIGHAQSAPIVVGGQDILTPTGPTACERNFGQDDPDGRWLNELFHSLCKRGDADSLLAVYLLSLPGWSSNGAQIDDRLLRRALTLNKTDPKLLWLGVLRGQCASPLPGCKAAKSAVRDAQVLVATNPDNAMVWFALAYAEDQAMQSWGVNAALDRAAKAPRVHDYTFDLTRLVARASAAIPAAAGHEEQTQDIRWTQVVTTPALGAMFYRWATGNCQLLSNEGDPDRQRFCEAAKAQFKRGDSRITLSGDTHAQSAIKKVLDSPRGATDARYRQVLLDTIGESSSEREWSEKAALRLKSLPKAH